MQRFHETKKLFGGYRHFNSEEDSISNEDESLKAAKNRVGGSKNSTASKRKVNSKMTDDSGKKRHRGASRSGRILKYLAVSLSKKMLRVQLQSLHFSLKLLVNKMILLHLVIL